ncbi:MAG: response regulator [Firmicutes bacterium]|nr:response regulator [Bacillota bacterium]
MGEKKILIVDDQMGVRRLLHEVFKNEGYKTYMAENGREAVEYANEKRPDMVLLDMKLPGMNGLEIFEKLKGIIPDAIFIMMTAYGEMESIQKAMNMGAVCYFLKPFDIIELKEKVAELFESENSKR